MAQDNGFGGFWDQAFPGAIQPGPVSQAPTNAYNATGGAGGTFGQNLAKKNGPWDKYRMSIPNDVSPEWWNAFLDTQNYTYEQADQSGKEKVEAYVKSTPPEAVATLAKGMSEAQLQNKSGGYAPKGTYQSAPRVPQGQTAGGQTDLAAQAEAVGSQVKAVNDANAKDQTNYWNTHVEPALTNYTQAAANQVTGNREAEAQLAAGGDTLKSLLAATQGQRTSGIDSANAQQTQALNTLTGKLDAADSALDQNLGTFKRQLTGSNNAQNQALSGYQNKLGALDTQEATLVNTLTNQLNGLNQQDRAAYLDYLNKTNPQLAAMVAQGSDKKYVQQQQDVYDQYKAQSNPEVTAQERYIAELARRQTENNDKNSRDAVQASLEARGLNSGGQIIAGQYAARQNTAQDRVLAELGIQANAVGRAQTNLAGAAGVAGQLRNADDAMKQFSDQYAQNDAIRRSNLALQQNQQGLATTGQAGQRDATMFDAGRANVLDTGARAGAGYDAASQTIRDNSGRDTQGYHAGFETTGAKVQNAGTGFDATTKTVGSNFDRSSYGWDTADQNAGTGYAADKDQAYLKRDNRSAEAGTAGGVAGTSLAAAGGYTGMRQPLTAAEVEALYKVFGNKVAAGAPTDDEDEN